MKEHTKIDYQVIKQDGEPAFAVVPYAEFKEMLELNNLDETTMIPNDVVEKHSIEGKSIFCAWREYLRITQEDISKRLGISQAAVAQQEAPDSRPHNKTRQKWADALGVDIEQLKI